MYCIGFVLIMVFGLAVDAAKVKRSYSDQSVRGYLTEVYMEKTVVIIFNIKSF